jgi:Dis3-like cold-shock domain 2 (CSD2)
MCGQQPRGKVVYIWKRQQRGPYCGALQPFSPLVPGREGKLQLSNEDSSVLFKPLDGRAPALLVNMRLLPRQYVDNPAEYKLGLFAATIDKYWPANSKMPRAQVCTLCYMYITCYTTSLLCLHSAVHSTDDDKRFLWSYIVSQHTVI